MEQIAAEAEAERKRASEVELLAALIFCEAGNQCYEGKVAVGAARRRYDSAQMRTAELAERILLDESNGWTNLLTTRKRVDATRRNLDLAKENLDISTYAYNEGLTTILDVLQAQISWLQIYTNAITAQYDYAVAVAAYRYVTATMP